MNTVSLTNILDGMTGNRPWSPQLHGIVYTYNSSRIMREVSKTIASYLERLPSNPSTMITIHELRAVSASPKSDSVFATRQAYYLLEIMGCTMTRVRERITRMGLWSMEGPAGKKQ